MKAQEEYKSLLNSGMFWEFYPELTGEWGKDKKQWAEIFKELEETRKRYYQQIKRFQIVVMKAQEREVAERRNAQETLELAKSQNKPVKFDVNKQTLNKALSEEIFVTVIDTIETPKKVAEVEYIELKTKKKKKRPKINFKEGEVFVSKREEEYEILKITHLRNKGVQVLIRFTETNNKKVYSEHSIRQNSVIDTEKNRLSRVSSYQSLSKKERRKLNKRQYNNLKEKYLEYQRQYRDGYKEYYNEYTRLNQKMNRYIKALLKGFDEEYKRMKYLSKLKKTYKEFHDFRDYSADALYNKYKLNELGVEKLGN